MRGPDRPGEKRQRSLRDALLRPMHLLMLAIGAAAFALTWSWWVPPLTLVTYAALVFLAVRYPTSGEGTLQGGQVRPSYLRPLGGTGSPGRTVPPEKRARRLPQGETRRRVEEALEARRRTLFAVKESDDATRGALSDAIPKLDAAVERLVDVALLRERAAGARQRGVMPDTLREADATLSGAIEELSAVRARVVRISTESGTALREAAEVLSADLDALNLRLDALLSAFSPEP